MRRLFAAAACSLLTLCFVGCPPAEGNAEAPSQPETSLSLRVAADEPTVGGQATLQIGFNNDGSALFGAMIADDSGARLTQWHADPADAVEFEADTNTATFKRAGTVKLWATWTDADGSELTSNEVEVAVGEAGDVTPQ